jgi:hypothetical protein
MRLRFCRGWGRRRRRRRRADEEGCLLDCFWRLHRIASHRTRDVFFGGVVCVSSAWEGFSGNYGAKRDDGYLGFPILPFFFLFEGRTKEGVGRILVCFVPSFFPPLSLSLSLALALAFMLPSTRGFICVISILVRHGRISSSRVFWFHHFPHLRSILRGSARRPERAVFMYIKST